MTEHEGHLVDEDESGGADAAFHAQAVVALLDEVVPGSEMDEVRDALPADEGWETFFELVDAEEVPREQPGEQSARAASTPTGGTPVTIYQFEFHTESDTRPLCITYHPKTLLVGNYPFSAWVPK